METIEEIQRRILELRARQLEDERREEREKYIKEVLDANRVIILAERSLSLSSLLALSN